MTENNYWHFKNNIEKNKLWHKHADLPTSRLRKFMKQTSNILIIKFFLISLLETVVYVYFQISFMKQKWLLMFIILCGDGDC